MEDKYNIEGLKRIYKCFLGDEGEAYVKIHYLEASNNVIKFYEAMKPTLEDDEAYIIDRSFGINSIQMTYPELAEKLNITEENVREIAAIAIRKLKHPSRARIGYALLLGKGPQTYLNEEIEIPSDLSEQLIEELPFSIRAKNILKRENIITLEDLVNTTMEQLIQIKNIGKKSIKEIEEFLNKYNLRLKY